MKIAIFHHLPSGGAKRALYNLTKHLMRGGHVVDAFVPASADEAFLPLKEVVSGYRVFPKRRTPLGTASAVLRRMGQLGSSWIDHEATQESIADAINAGSYDVMLCEQDLWTFSPFILKYVAGPVVYSCQQPDRSQEAILDAVFSSAVTEGQSGRWDKWRSSYVSRRANQVDKDNARFASYIVTNSYFSREVILRAYGLNPFVSYLGTDIDLFRPMNEPRENYVLSVGMCSREKGFDFLIRTLGRMEPKLRPKFIIVSNMTDPVWEAHVVRLAGMLNVDLSIKKCVSDSELVRFYNRAKLFVYAPYLEPFGLVVLEAMACGTPVIAVQEGGVRESIVHNETGVLVDRDEEAFAQVIRELLQDEAERARLACRALEVVRSFWTWQRATERLEGHLVRRANRHGR
jgi:glycosyltransferase involved in cell wall biosynthesis